MINESQASPNMRNRLRHSGLERHGTETAPCPPPEGLVLRVGPLGQQHSDNSALSRFESLQALVNRFERFPVLPPGGLPPPRKAPPAQSTGCTFRVGPRGVAAPPPGEGAQEA
eukprot:4726144-Alexandrium_andersonii.AAC.1